jgi:hypothetical protein
MILRLNPYKWRSSLASGTSVIVPAHDPTMADAVYGTLAVISTLLYALSYPVIKAIRLVALIVSPFWAIAQFVLLPVTYSIHGILTVALFPFRLRLLERLEVTRAQIELEPIKQYAE